MSLHSVTQVRLSSGHSQDEYVVLLGELAAFRSDVYQHSQRVAELAACVAAAFPALDDQPWEIERAALAHDIGKLAIPLALLQKPAALTAAERRLMQTHAAVGAELLGALPGSDNLVRLARAHHERLDGTGYPDGLRAHRIPVGAQIIAVCDSWDAMTSPRHYGKTLTFDEAAAELRAHAGTQWRDDVVHLTLEIVRAARPHAFSTSQ
jgi:two-component system cell cycle response regulator